MDEAARLTAAARSSRLVIFAGAGVSVAAPTNLPSWRDFNRVVVRALAVAAAPAVTGAMSARAAEIVLARHEQKKLPPEYQAQVLAETLNARYFEVLRHLDSERPNATHLAIAWLARLGCVRAVVTTNFDRALEAAFAQVGAPIERCYQPEHFRSLSRNLARLDARGGACQLLKLHGSVDDPATLIDTLAQRKRGLAPETMDCVRHLLRSAHWLFLGYSGLDLAAEPNYLALRQEAERALGFTWFVRAKTEPLEAVVRVRELYGERGGFVQGELPAWTLDWLAAMSVEARDWIARRSGQTTALDTQAQAQALEQSVTEWARQLSPWMSSLALTMVVIACAEPQTAAALAEQMLAAIDERQARGADLPLLRGAVANTLGLLLAGLGRHAEAVHWLEIAVKSATKADDADTADRCRGNLAQSLETLGRIDEARATYDAALAGYRLRDDPLPVAFGLTNLSAHLIRQARFDEARPLADEAVRRAITAGDERTRGIALALLGKIAKLKREYPRALELLSDVEALFTRLGDDEAAAAAAGDRAEVLTALGRYDESGRIQLEVLRVNQRLERLDNVGATYAGLGALAFQRGDPTAAERWYTQAKETYRAIADPSNQAFVAKRLAEIQLDTRREQDALATAQEALPLVEGRNAALFSDLFELIGKANLRLGYVVRAEQAYRKVCEFAVASSNRRVLAGASTNLGTVLLLQQRDAEAAETFARGAQIWSELGEQDQREYCLLGEAAVQLDQRLAVLSNAGHAARTANEMRAYAGEMVALYPQLIAMYEKIGATSLVAEFCSSAASTAKVVGALDQAGRWYHRAAGLFGKLARADRARQALDRGEDLLRSWTNTLIDNGEFARALPDVLLLAEVAEQLGHDEMCASALLNAGIILVRTSGEYARAKELAERSLALLPSDSNDVAVVRTLISHCEDALSRR